MRDQCQREGIALASIDMDSLRLRKALRHGGKALTQPMDLYRMDLHIIRSSPRARNWIWGRPTLSRCREEDIDLIAITDHNSALNCEALNRASTGSGVEVICGLEVQSSEDIHVLCLMPDLEKARAFEEWVRKRLPPYRNIPDKFGDQFVIDEDNHVIDEYEILLVQGIDATADEIIRKPVPSAA